jgi:hypothetical protein
MVLNFATTLIGQLMTLVVTISHVKLITKTTLPHQQQRLDLHESCKN